MPVFRNLLLIFILSASLPDMAGAQVISDSVPEVSGVAIYTDPRLEVLYESWKTRPSLTGSRVGAIRSGRGFRVQIYNGNDRNEANRIKLDFMRRHPDVRVYMSYIQPQYRVKVGDFRTRAEARELAGLLEAHYSPIIIVPDIVVIKTLRDDQ